ELSTNSDSYQIYPCLSIRPPNGPQRLRPNRLSSGNWQNSQLAALFYLRPECQEEPPGCKSPAPNQSVLYTRSLQRMKGTEGYTAPTQKTSGREMFSLSSLSITHIFILGAALHVLVVIVIVNVACLSRFLPYSCRRVVIAFPRWHNRGTGSLEGTTLRPRRVAGALGRPSPEKL